MSYVGNEPKAVVDSNVIGNLTVTGSTTMPNGLTNAINDAAAATAGVLINQLYRNGSVVMIRVV